MKEVNYEEKIKALEAEIKIMKERYRILAETTPSILFEYWPDKDRMIFSFNFPDNQKRQEIENYHEYVKEHPLVHPDHYEKFMLVLRKASNAPVKGEMEYLSRVTSEKFEWHRTYYSSIAGDDGKVISVLGRIQNIHKSVTERQKIMHKVETDFLTGLYNKGAATEKVCKWLKRNPTSEACMVMLDIDDFKVINDSYGHSVGDEVLKETAKLMEQCFGEHSILSRCGGDEFLVFIPDEPCGYVENRLDTFMGKLAEEVNVVEQSLHCSAGIAPRVSKYDDFEDFFNRADNVMYLAKKSGKNRYFVYRE